ncbi:hypothetical protein P5673_000902 [Acropora cervicornis]|uniref:Uncharacterized protein n=1 Tax=Acropora cervicornis TaxID=6130 RepID=A0AAD9R573_ACRCE|nr:hypothetical protein P5673_000902 [Acropora cervicornis]
MWWKKEQFGMSVMSLKTSMTRMLGHVVCEEAMLDFSARFSIKTICTHGSGKAPHHEIQHTR